MKKKLIFAAVLAVISVCVYFAYDYLNKPPETEPGAEFTLILIDNSTEEAAEKTLVHKTEAVFLLQALEEMKNEGELTGLETNAGFIESIDILSDKSAQGYWLFMYTSLTDERYISADEFSPPFEYEGKSYAACSKGAAETPIADGAIYIIAYVYWG
jgi:hypothetical protein